MNPISASASDAVASPTASAGSGSDCVVPLATPTCTGTGSTPA